MPLFTRISSSIGYVFVLYTVMVSGQTMSVKIVRRQNSETGYTYQVSGHLRSTSNEDANCNANSDEDSTHVSCHGSGTTNTTITAPQTISYSVTGATYSLLLPDGRVAVVNCASKSDNGFTATMTNMARGWDAGANNDSSGGSGAVKRSCRTPLVDDIQVEFKGKNAKLKWPISINSKKFESETYNIIGVLDSAESKSVVGSSTDSKSRVSVQVSDSAAGSKQEEMYVESVNSYFKSNNLVGYAESSGDTLTVHSERASAMRFHMNVADKQEMQSYRTAGFKTFVYTNDSDQRFTYDLVTEQIVTPRVSTATPLAPEAEPSVNSGSSGTTSKTVSSTIPQNAPAVVTAASPAPATGTADTAKSCVTDKSGHTVCLDQH